MNTGVPSSSRLARTSNLVLLLVCSALLTSCGKDDPYAIEAAQPPTHVYELGQTIRFGTRGNSHRHVLTGWGETEPGFRWTDGIAAALAFRMPATNGGVTLELLATAFTHQPGLPTQPVDVIIDGEKIAHWEVAELKRYRAVVPQQLLRPEPHDWIVDLYIPKAISPARLGMGGDFRRLGLQVFELKFLPAVPVESPERKETAEPRQP